MNVSMVKILAIMVILATSVSAQIDTRRESELVNVSSTNSGPTQQSVDKGWIPTSQANQLVGKHSTIAEAPKRYLDAISEPERAKKRESLRRAYRSATWTGKGYTSEGKEALKDYVAKDGFANKNYVVMFTAEWCSACKQMYPLIRELRNEGYKVYVMDIEKFPDIDAAYNITSLPTFVVFDEGEEFARKVGVASKDWFTGNMVTIDAQNEPEPEPEPENPYEDLL